MCYYKIQNADASRGKIYLSSKALVVFHTSKIILLFFTHNTEYDVARLGSVIIRMQIPLLYYNSSIGVIFSSVMNDSCALLNYKDMMKL